MSFNLLKGKRGIIFGALNDASIAWKVAERAVEEGAQRFHATLQLSGGLLELNLAAFLFSCQVLYDIEIVYFHRLALWFTKVINCPAENESFMLFLCIMSKKQARRHSRAPLPYCSYINGQ